MEVVRRSISLNPIVSNEQSMETERDYGAKVEKRADTMQHAELGVQSLHLCRNLLNASVKLTVRSRDYGYPGFIVYFALLLL